MGWISSGDILIFAWPGFILTKGKPASASLSLSYDPCGRIESMERNAGTKGRAEGTYAYSPYGELEEGYKGSGTPFLFQDDYLDPQTLLYLMQARWYDPSTSTLLSQDPEMGEAQDPQLRLPYTYCAGDPVNNSDPSGKTAKDLALAMQKPVLARLIARNPSLMLFFLLKPAAGKKTSFLGGLLGNITKAEARSSSTATPKPSLLSGIWESPGMAAMTEKTKETQYYGRTSNVEERKPNLVITREGHVFATYKIGDKTVTINLTEPYVVEGEVGVQRKLYQFFTDIIRSLLGRPRTFPLGRDFRCRTTLLYEKETGTLRLVVETSTKPGGGHNSPYSNVAVLQHTDIVTREGRRYEMAPFDPGTRIVSPGDISGEANYHCYTIDVTPEELPIAIYTYNLYSWNQGIDFRGTAGDEEIVYCPLPMK